MGWSSVIGQERVKSLLRRSVQQRSVAHAYLFHGRDGVGKDALALAFAKVLQCEKGGVDSCDECSNCRRVSTLQHPDVRLIFALPVGNGEKPGDDPLEKLTDDTIDVIQEQIRTKATDPYHEIMVPKAQNIKINSVRDVKREASLSPVEGRYKIFLLLQADAMNVESANSLLKTLEEPLPNAVLLLTSAYRDRLPPTITSRCQQLECPPLRTDELREALLSRDNSASLEEAATAARLGDGSYRRARQMLGSDLASERAEVVQYLRLALGSQAVPLASEIERIVGAHDRPHLEDWLVLLQSWLRDALALRTGRRVDDMSGDAAMENFLKKFPSASLSGSIAAVDSAIADLRKNVYVPLILTTLAHQLRACVQNSPQRV